MTNPNHPASPQSPVTQSSAHPQAVFPGLTKREAFAMFAMQGLLAYPHLDRDSDQIASASVRTADALIKALNKETE